MSAKKSRAKKPATLTVTERKLLAKLAAKAGLIVAEPQIETPRMTRETNVKKSNRAFWTDGAHAFLRRKKANPAMRERVNEKVKKREYTHVKTSDDVEIYAIAEWSPLYRRQLNLQQISTMRIESHIIRAACKGDWRLYYDAVSEYAHRHKNSQLPSATGEMMLQQSMRYLEHRIMRRGGPTPMMIHHELSKIRKERTGAQIFLPH